MLLSKKETQWLAKKIVNVSCRIKQKDNPHYLAAVKKYPWIANDFTYSQAKQKSKMSDDKLKKLLKKYEHVNYGPLLIKKGKKYQVKKKISMTVQLGYHPTSKELAYEITKECWRKGAVVSSKERTNAVIRDAVQLSPLTTLYELPPLSRAVYENIDYIISLESRDWAGWSQGLPHSKLAAGNASSLELHKIEDRRQTPWVLVGWPFKKRAQENKIPFGKLKKIMFDCIRFSYSNEIKKLVLDYTAAFKNKEKIRIVANDGTDLTFSLKGRRLNKDVAEYDEEGTKRGDVGKNIPTGEIFFAPVETSANGTLFIPKAAIEGQGVADRLMIHFKNGKVIKSTAKKGNDYLPKFIKENSKDADRIAEFGIGLNKKSEFTGGEIIIDEKIFGSIHIAIGWNKGYGGKTNASSHLDFIKDLRTCDSKVYGDSKLILKNGKLV